MISVADSIGLGLEVLLVDNVVEFQPGGRRHVPWPLRSWMVLVVLFEPQMGDGPAKPDMVIRLPRHLL